MLPNQATAQWAILYVGVLGFTELVTCMILVFADGPLSEGQPWAVLLLMAGLGSVVAAEICILRQPQNKYVNSSYWKQLTLVRTTPKKTHTSNFSLSREKNVNWQSKSSRKYSVDFEEETISCQLFLRWSV